MKKRIIYLNHRSLFQNNFMVLNNFYKLCAKKSNIVFFDLRSYLNVNLIWFLSLKYLTQYNNVDFLILDELEEKTLFGLKNFVIQGKYKWGVFYQQGLGRKSINKSNLKNLLVEEVLKILIEPIFEINFEENSFGFRPFRTCHTAFSYLSCKMKNSFWVLDCNLYNWFDYIPLIFFFKKFCFRVKDPLILGLLQIGLNNKIFNNKNNFLTDLGIPIGGGFSSLMVNIYLDSFDKWINNICLFYLKTNLKSFNFLCSSINYIRYGNIFLVSISDSFCLAIELHSKITSYLKKQLYVLYDSVYFKLKHLLQGILFLGHLWKIKLFVLNSKLRPNKQISRLVLQIDLKVILKLLQKWKICDGSGKALPLFLYLHFSQKEANLRVNAILSFFCDWLKCAFNRRYILGFISAIFRLSLAKMYAAKFKLKTTSAVWGKGGYFLNKSLGVTERKNNTIPKILYCKYNQIPY